MERRRVVVTGMGVKSPAGNTLDTFWDTLVAAACTAAGPIERVDVSDWPVQFACEVKDFDPEAYIEAKEVLRLPQRAIKSQEVGLTDQTYQTMTARNLEEMK